MLIRTLQKVERRDGLNIVGDVNAWLRKWASDTKGSSQATATRVTESSAMTLPWAYAAINVLSDTVAHVPLELRRKNGKTGGSVKAEDHPLYDLVSLAPSSRLTSFNWRKTIESHRSGWGNGRTWIRRREGTREIYFQILPAAQTTTKLLDSDDIVHETMIKGQAERVLDLDCLHFMGMGYDGIQGFSPPHVLRQAFSAGLSMQQFNDKFFANGAHLKGVIESEVGGNQYAKFVDEFKEKYGSLENAHGTPVLPKGMKYSQITINPDDAQFLELMKFNRNVIAGIYRVPAHLINDQENNTFTNVIEMDIGFVKHSMVPIYTNYEQELNRKLLTRKEIRDGYFFRFNANGLLRGAQKDRYDSYHAALQDGWMNRNEVRRLEDMDTVDGLDEFMVPHNMKSASQLAAPLVNSLSQRVAAAGRRGLEKCGSDQAQAATFMATHREWVLRNVEPIAVSLEYMTGQPAEQLTRAFVDRHINQVLGSMTGSIAEAIPQITEASVTRTFYEVLNDGETIHSGD